MSNRIKSETIYRIDHVPGEEVNFNPDSGYKQSCQEYNPEGRILLELTYTFEGDISDRIEYHYDEKGRLKEALTFGENEELLERKELAWTDGDRISLEIIHYLDGSADFHEFFYDEKGNLTGIQVRNDDDEIEFEETYFYESDLVRMERRDEDDELVYMMENTYLDGVLRERTIWSAEEEEPYTYVQRFNSAGHREEELRYNSQGQLSERNVYSLDSEGRIISMVEENRLRKNTTEFAYDGKGNVTFQKETDLNGELNHEVFRHYDETGQPVKTTVEAAVKPSQEIRAYTLFYIREFYG